MESSVSRDWSVADASLKKGREEKEWVSGRRIYRGEGAVAWCVYSEGGGVEALIPGVCTVKLVG